MKKLNKFIPALKTLLIYHALLFLVVLAIGCTKGKSFKIERHTHSVAFYLNLKL